MRLLERFLEILFPPSARTRLVRENELPRAKPVSFALTGADAVGLLPYRTPVVRAFITEAKFHGNREAQKALGAILADHLLERVAEETAFGTEVVLIPIPLSTERKRERGYNQTEEICCAALPRLGSRVRLMSEALIRTRNTLPQTKLARSERLKNMQGAFVAPQALDPAHTYIVVDDVVTTGTTLLAAVAALRAQGATKLSVVALAH